MNAIKLSSTIQPTASKAAVVICIHIFNIYPHLVCVVLVAPTPKILFYVKIMVY